MGPAWIGAALGPPAVGAVADDRRVGAVAHRPTARMPLRPALSISLPQVHGSPSARPPGRRPGRPPRSMLVVTGGQAPAADRRRYGRARHTAERGVLMGLAGTLAPGNGADPAPLLAVEHLTVHFPVKKGVLIDRVVARVRAVDDISFTLDARQTLGVVGESGCGKSTLALCLLRLLEPTGGRICFKGTEIGAMQRAELKNLRR